MYSTTLEPVSSARTLIEREFDPEAVRQMKAAAGRDITVGGPDLAAQAIRAGLVDECHLFVTPIVVGGGKHFLPGDVRLKLELLDEQGSPTACSPSLPHQDVTTPSSGRVRAVTRELNFEGTHSPAGPFDLFEPVSGQRTRPK